MADDARRPGDDLTAPLSNEMGFFELLRRLERPGQKFGRGGGPKKEPARLGQGARLAVATRDVARFTNAVVQGAPPLVDVEVIGLLGPEGPVPLHFTRWIFDRTSQRWFEAGNEHATADTTALDFCNMIQHRMMALYWRAWGDSQPSVHIDRPGAGRPGAMVATLAGLGLPGQRGGPPHAREAEAVTLDHAMQLAHEVHGAERLTAPVAALLGAPVRLVEFIGGWIEIPPHLQTCAGRAHARLGQGAVVGARTYSRQDRAEIRVGAVGLVAYLRMADDRAFRARLRHLLLHLVGRETRFDLRLVLAENEVPEPRLGRVAIGRTAWLPSRRPSDRDDLCLPRITRDNA